MNSVARPHLLGLLAGLFLAVGLVLSALLGATTWTKVRNREFITVKGSARRNIKSDLVIWRGTFTVEAKTLLEAQQELKFHQTKVSQFVRDHGFTNVVFAPIGIEEVTATAKGADGLTQHRKVGYRLSQAVRVESGDVEGAARLDADSMTLVEQGVVFTMQPPAFIYTKAGEAKVEMLAEATKDARSRADQIASQGDRHVARLHHMPTWVFCKSPHFTVGSLVGRAPTIRPHWTRSLPQLSRRRLP